MEKEPENKIARWAYAIYYGDQAEAEADVEGDENFRIIKAIGNW